LAASQSCRFHPKPSSAAIRVIVQAVKHGAAPLVLLPPLTLNDAEGRPSAEAEAILRGDATIPMQALSGARLRHMS
jgi:tRNA1(Val) A37 N6-methylase TrmN6